MKHGYLSAHFSGVAVKKLSMVEISSERSHQHEFNGSAELVRLLGQAGGGKQRIPAWFMYLSDEEEPARETAVVTWYDARAKSAARTGRSEHRLYFPENDVMKRVRVGDVLFLARTQQGFLLFLIAEANSGIARQLHWLFGLSGPIADVFSVRAGFESDRDRLGVTAALILEQIGISAELDNDDFLDGLLARFGPKFPTTREFSEYARQSLSRVRPKEDPDGTLIAWMDREEVLFRTLEKHLVGERLRQGFLAEKAPDIEGFMSYSLSVQNRRKARTGAALENHLEALFTRLDLRFARGAITERNNRPDFLFPDAAAYHDADFPSARLTMLVAKTAAKERWRQITKEADRIELRHLLTLQPAISEQQTTQMRDSGVQLVVPSALHGEYTQGQREWLITLCDFAALVRKRQE